MAQPQTQIPSRDAASHADVQALIERVHGIRYLVEDVARAVAFYT
jgi:hypothetical protein